MSISPNSAALTNAFAFHVSSSYQILSRSSPFLPEVRSNGCQVTNSCAPNLGSFFSSSSSKKIENTTTDGDENSLAATEPSTVLGDGVPTDDNGGMEPKEEKAVKRARVSEVVRYHVYVIPRNITQVEFRQGDRVLVRPKTRREFAADACFGTFDKVVVDDASTKMAWIKLDNDNETSLQVPYHRLFPVVTPPRRQDNVVTIVVAYDTASFRQLGWAQLQPHKKNNNSKTERHVLELGCSTGETSEILWQQATSWVGLDTSTEMIQRVQEKIKRQNSAATPLKLRCERLDALVDPPRAKQVACTFHGTGPTDVFLDIGGDRSEKAIWRMLHLLCAESSFPELEQVVIKSEELHTTLWKALPLDKKHESIPLSNLCLERDKAWLQDKVATLLGDTLVGDSIQKLPKHPLKAPMRLSPADGKTPICRFHNYHAKGCARFKGDKSCPYDHTFCHWCLESGHVARDCPAAKALQDIK